MPKNIKVKGFCPVCGDPVVSGGKEENKIWYHNPCYTTKSYGTPQNIKKNQRPRRSAPPEKEIKARSTLGLNPMSFDPTDYEPEENPSTDLEILAHAKDVTLACNPPDKEKQFFIWEGPRMWAKNIVRFPQYQQANRYYRDVIDGKTGGGSLRNPLSGSTKPLLIALGVLALVGGGYFLVKKYGLSGSIKNKIPDINMIRDYTGIGTDYTNAAGHQRGLH